MPTNAELTIARAQTTPERLKEHVYTLAGEIGERSVFRPYTVPEL
jgi:hypothetical protein